MTENNALTCNQAVFIITHSNEICEHEIMTVKVTRYY